MLSSLVCDLAPELQTSEIPEGFMKQIQFLVFLCECQPKHEMFLCECQPKDEVFLLSASRRTKSRNQYSVQSFLKLYENKTTWLKNNSFVSWPKNNAKSHEIIPYLRSISHMNDSQGMSKNKIHINEQYSFPWLCRLQVHVNNTFYCSSQNTDVAARSDCRLTVAVRDSGSNSCRPNCGSEAKTWQTVG
jgi:hypothetical protein